MVMSHWSNRFSILGCLVDEKPSRRQPSAKRLRCHRSHNNVARKTSHFGKPDVWESRNWNKAFRKRAEHSHASKTPDGHRTIVGGTSKEGLPSMGPIKLSGGTQPLRTVEGERLSEWAVQVEWSIPTEGPVWVKQAVCVMSLWCHKTISTWGFPWGKSFKRLCSMVIWGEVCLNPGQQQCMLGVLYVPLWWI